MQRIAIIGCGGSGKSRLARELGAVLGLPVTHLDTLYYDESWNSLTREEFAVLQQGLVAAPAWVIDGNYASTLPIRLAAADTVVLLDLPPLTCLWGIAQRRLRGSPDRITLGFIRYVCAYRRSMRPRVLCLLADHASHAELVTLATRRCANRWLRSRLSEVGGHGSPAAVAPAPDPAAGR